MDPKFRKRGDGRASLFDSEEAKRVRGEKRPWAPALSPEQVKESAKEAVLLRGGDPDNVKHLLGQYQMQFGMFRGQTFQWVAENALGYAGYVVASMSAESGSSDSYNNLINKRAFQEYLSYYPEGQYAIQVKKEGLSSKSQSQPLTATVVTSTQSSTSSQAAIPSQLSTSPRLSSVPVSSLRSLLIGKGRSQQTIDKSVKKLFTQQKFQPCKYAT